MPGLTVSFCIPTHGRTHLLLEALESGLMQTRLPNEIVVSDDLGSGETRALVETFAKRASFPVRYVHCTVGQSLAENINNCLREAACDLILLLHDDDLLLPRAVEVMARPFEENSEIVGTFGKQMVIADGGEEQPSEGLNVGYGRDAAHAGLQPDAILSGLQQQFPNDGYMVKTSVARAVQHTPEYGAASEVDFGIRMGEQGKFFFIDEYTAKYRLSAQSIGRGAGRKKDDCAYYTIRILLRLLETYPRYESEIVAKLKHDVPMGIPMAINKGKLQEGIDWYFSPYHRQRILSPGGIRRGLWLAKAWLRERFVRTA